MGLSRIFSDVNRLLVCSALLLAIAAPSFGQQPKPQPPKSTRLYVFDCGFLDIPDTSNYQLKKEELVTTKMAVPCFLIAHPRGTLMWDVGAVPDSSFKPEGGHAPLRYAHTTRRLTDQLADIGYTPADITYLSILAFPLGPRRQCESVRSDGDLAGSKTRARHHVRRAAISTNGAGKLQRTEKQQNRNRREG